MSTNHFKFMIIGGGNAAGYACREFVSLGLKPNELAVISNEPVAPYERPALSKGYLHPPQAKNRSRLPGFNCCVGSGGEKQLLEWYTEHGIHLILNAECEGVNFTKKIVEVAVKVGAQRLLKEFSYDKLIIATGCRALKPTDLGLPGGDLEYIFTIRTEADAAKIVSAMELLTSRKLSSKGKKDNIPPVKSPKLLRNNSQKSSKSSSTVFAHPKKSSDVPQLSPYLQVKKPGNPKEEDKGSMRKSTQRFGHEQSSKLRDHLKEQLDIKATKRNAIYAKLHKFYSKHDKSKLTNYETMSGLITFIETFGHEELNPNLLEKYGEGLEKPEPSMAKYQIVKDGMAERNEIYAKLFLFYNKHDASRIPDLEVAVEVIMNVGIEEFNRRCEKKYGETLDSQLIEKIVEIERQSKIVKQVEAPLGSLKQLREEADHSLDVEVQQLLVKLVTFYEKYDKSAMSELEKMITFVMENGVNMFDELTQEKYGDVLSKYLDAEVQRKREILERSSKDERRKLIVKALVRFYQKYDVSKLGKLHDMVAFIMYCGIQEFNNKLKAKYGDFLHEEPEDIVKEKNYIFSKLTRYYQVNDQTKLNTLEDIVTFIMINGKDEFNEMLIEKYGSGLNDVSEEEDTTTKIAVSNCLTDYYSANDPSKLRNIENLVAYAMANGIEELNKKVIAKYGKPLEYEKYKNKEQNYLSVNITSGYSVENSVLAHGQSRNPHVVIIGGGYVGLETASSFAGWGFDITLVIAQKLALSKLFTPKLAAWFERYLEENHAINLIKETRVMEFRGEKGKVQEVVLSNGEILACDAVICGIGGKPNIELFEGQIEMDRSALGGIKVNSWLQTSNRDTYAIGDVACFPHGKYRSRLEHVDNCRKSAATAVYNLQNSMQRDYVYFPYFYSRMFEYTEQPVVFRFYGEKGDTGEAEIVHFGDFNSSRASMFGAFWVNRKNVIIGGLLCNANPPEFYDKLHDIVLSGPMLKPKTEEKALSLFNEEMIVDLI